MNYTIKTYHSVNGAVSGLSLASKNQNHYDELNENEYSLKPERGVP